MKKLIPATIAAFMLIQNISEAQRNKSETIRQPKKIYEVNSVEFTVNKDAQELTARAYGVTKTEGWTKAALKPTFSTDKCDNGIYTFDFVALPPRLDEDKTQFTAVGEYVFKNIPANLKLIVVKADKNSIQSRFTEEFAQNASLSCDDSRTATLVFNSGGSYKIVLRKLEMGDRTDVSVCVSGTKSCWEHLQMLPLGASVEISNVDAGSSLNVHSQQQKSDFLINPLLNDINCVQKEGLICFADSKGFRMELKIEQMELSLNE